MTCKTAIEIANAIIDRIIERANQRGFATMHELRCYRAMIFKIYGNDTGYWNTRLSSRTRGLGWWHIHFLQRGVSDDVWANINLLHQLMCVDCINEANMLINTLSAHQIYLSGYGSSSGVWRSARQYYARLKDLFNRIHKHKQSKMNKVTEIFADVFIGTMEVTATIFAIGFVIAVVCMACSW